MVKLLITTNEPEQFANMGRIIDAIEHTTNYSKSWDEVSKTSWHNTKEPTVNLELAITDNNNFLIKSCGWCRLDWYTEHPNYDRHTIMPYDAFISKYEILSEGLYLKPVPKQAAFKEPFIKAKTIQEVYNELKIYPNR